MRKFRIFDRHGNEVLDRDKDEALRDGEIMRAPMLLMDSANSTPLQRAIAEHSRELGRGHRVHIGGNLAVLPAVDPGADEPQAATGIRGMQREGDW